MFLIFMERNTEGLKDRDVWNYFPAVQGGKKSFVEYVPVCKYRCSRSVHCTFLSTFSTSLLSFLPEAATCSLWSLSSPTRYGTCTPYIGSADS